MLGKPKYKLNDQVSFLFDNEIINGSIFIIDKYGTFDDDSDVSYDILSSDGKILYKHINEKLIIKKFNKKRR